MPLDIAKNVDRHRTEAWKDAVEKNLHKLGRGIMNEESKLEGEQLDARKLLSDGLRNIATNVQSEVTKQGSDDARQYSCVFFRAIAMG